MWRSKDNFVKSVFALHHYMGSGNRTQVTKLAQQASFPAEPSCQPIHNFQTTFSNISREQSYVYYVCVFTRTHDVKDIYIYIYDTKVEIQFKTTITECLLPARPQHKIGALSLREHIAEVIKKSKAPSAACQGLELWSALESLHRTQDPGLHPQHYRNNNQPLDGKWQTLPQHLQMERNSQELI